MALEDVIVENDDEEVDLVCISVTAQESCFIVRPSTVSLVEYCRPWNYNVEADLINQMAGRANLPLDYE